jgi:hypothetical protein
MTEPFDQPLYDRVMAEEPEFPYAIELAEPRTQSVWRRGYIKAARIAARISAERQPPVSDDSYRRIAAYANAVIGDSYPFRSDEPEDVAEAVRMGKAIHKRATELFPTTLGPAVPVIPEGWELNNISSGIANGEVDYGAALANGNRIEFGYGPTWLDALTAAIEAAKEDER